MLLHHASAIDTCCHCLVLKLDQQDLIRFEYFGLLGSFNDIQSGTDSFCLFDDAFKAISPVVLYGCESWSLTLRDEKKI
jgi:hypothetical protein